ncbi:MULTISPECIES: response regulator transcription factor [Ruminococcus]|uniref:Stage 0 sporulation protein A homolog n=1 Tax=Ruminococcus flavefaciens TaxID=1265 RepID=A0A1M7M8C5_RUMFL|nr:MULTISPECIES: response regulator transcription factor [Ruminococcus]MCR4795450.1 response regulator transcription factor [Ruminococcus sp.]SHM86525.1 two component transcriptional regulator, LuxR family [Ruminococcus flavefaciens]
MDIIVIDDDKLVALSLKTILENSGKVTVAAMGSSGKEAIELYREIKPDVILMDIRMEGMTGIEAGEVILKEFPDAKILYLTTFSDDEYIIKALNMGAQGYILKQDFDGIVPALETVMGGQSVYGSTIMNKLPELMKPKDKYDFAAHGISDKEREIMELVAEGLSNKEISGKLFLGEGTIRNYISNLLDKLELRDRTQLAVYYYTEVKGLN